MRYAISFTPPPGDPLTLGAAQWLGRNAFSGHPVEPPALRGLTIPEIAYYTALPRRYGFHAALKAPFRLSEKMSESMLLRHLMRFAGTIAPFSVERMEVARLGDFYGLAPSCPSEQLLFLAAAVVQEFDAFRAPLSEEEIERRDLHGLSAAQLANLHRWGCPYVMDEFRFYMSLTGPAPPAVMAGLGRRWRVSSRRCCRRRWRSPISRCSSRRSRARPSGCIPCIRWDGFRAAAAPESDGKAVRLRFSVSTFAA